MADDRTNENAEQIKKVNAEVASVLANIVDSLRQVSSLFPYSKGLFSNVEDLDNKLDALSKSFDLLKTTLLHSSEDTEKVNRLFEKLNTAIRTLVSKGHLDRASELVLKVSASLEKLATMSMKGRATSDDLAAGISELVRLVEAAAKASEKASKVFRSSLLRSLSRMIFLGDAAGDVNRLVETTQRKALYSLKNLTRLQSDALSYFDKVGEAIKDLGRLAYASSIKVGSTLGKLGGGFLAVTGMVVQGIMQSFGALKAAWRDIQKYLTYYQDLNRTIAQSSDVVRASSYAFRRYFRDALALASAFGISMDEFRRSFNALATQFSIFSRYAIFTARPVSILTMRFLELRYGISNAADYLFDMISTMRGEFNRARRDSRSLSVALVGLNSVRQALARLGYAATLLNQPFRNFINTLRVVGSDLRESTKAFRSAYGLFVLAGDSMYMRFKDWSSVIENITQKISTATGGFRAFLGVLAGFSGAQAYWAGAGYLFRGGRLVPFSELGMNYFEMMTRGLMSFIHRVVPEISSPARAMVLEQILKQYLGLNDKLATQLTAYLSTNSALYEAVSKFGFSEKALRYYAEETGRSTKEFKSLFKDIERHQASSKEIMWQTVDRLSNISKRVESINTLLDKADAFLRLSMSMVTGSLALLVAKLVGGIKVPWRELTGFVGFTFSLALEGIKAQIQAMGSIADVVARVIRDESRWKSKGEVGEALGEQLHTTLAQAAAKQGARVRGHIGGIVGENLGVHIGGDEYAAILQKGEIVVKPDSSLGNKYVIINVKFGDIHAGDVNTTELVEMLADMMERKATVIANNVLEKNV